MSGKCEKAILAQDGLFPYDEPFEDRSTPQEQAEAQRRWAQFRKAKEKQSNHRTRRRSTKRRR